MDHASRFSARSPNLFSILLATALAGTMGLLGALLAPLNDLPARMVLIAALLLISNDLMETACLGAGPRTWRNPDRWVIALVFGWYFTLALLLFGAGDQIDGLTRLFTTAIGGAIFGLWMAFGSGEPQSWAVSDRWLLDAPITATRRDALYYRLWPVAVIVLMVGMLAWAPDTAPPYYFWLLAMLAFQVPYYRAKPGLPIGHDPMVSRLLGIALAVIGTLMLA